MKSPHYHLTYKKLGNGPKVLLLFHGFGQSGDIYTPWVPHLRKEYTLLLFDLYFHGNSTAPFRNLSKAEWADQLNDVLNKEQIDRFEVAGFSLGGRFAITTAMEFTSRLDRLTLLAPDGIFLTPWFHLATAPVMRSLFRYFMANPKATNRLIQFSVKTRLINKYMADFVHRELGAPENRERVFRSWNYFKPLGYKPKQLEQKLAEVSFPKHLVVGTKDIVIPPKKILPLVRETNFHAHVLDKKHHQMIKVDVIEHLIQKWSR